MAGKAKQPAPKTRQLKSAPYRSFRLGKRVRHPKARLTSGWKLFRAGVRHLSGHKKLFLGIVLIYLILTVVMVKGLGVSAGTAELKETLQELFTGRGGTLLTGVTLFGVLVSSTGSASSDVAGLYQTIIVIITSLALVWALRQTHAKTKTTTKEAFYKGMYPLIPFLLVLLVIGLQLLPLVVANWLYTVVIAGGLAVTGVEQAVWIILIALLVLLSVYLATSSVFALYIVTLPDMTPMKALRSARELVRYRRWTIMRKVLFMPLMLLIIGALIMVPLIIFVTPLAEWVYFVLSMASLALIHSYMYGLYRELL